MENNNETIGAILINERLKRELSLDEVHEATKITVHNLSALEEDRFDHFPNRVYARAFLRDYANFLGLDSGELLDKYETDWHGLGCETVQSPAPKRRSAWKPVLVALLTLIVLGGIAAAGYYDMGGFKIPSVVRREAEKQDVAQLPKLEPIAPAKPEAAAKPEKKPEEKPEPEAPKPALPQGLTLEVTAARPVWADIKADGEKVIYGILPAGIKTVTAKKVIFIKVGQANAVSLKLNGKQQPAMGTTANMAKTEFKLPEQPVASESTPVTSPSATDTDASTIR
jgi:cytoskeletal protein RodZ